MDAAHDLEALAKRVEAAAGPDRELDCAIFRAIGAPVPFQFANNMVALAYDESERAYFAPIGDMRVRYEPPSYSASLDAAMTLVPEGWFWDVGGYRDGSGNATVQAPDYDEDTFNGISVWIEAKTPALALAAASLRALSQGVNDDAV